MQTSSVTSTPAKRHACVGLTYYTAWMRTHGNAPVCVGFSQVKDETTPAEQAAELQQNDKDFKLICLGYSSYSSAEASHMPHCEGIEVVLETPIQSENSQHAPKDGQEEAAVQPLHTRWISKAAHNFGQILAAFRNEGPVVLKPIPKDYEEVQKRVLEQVERNRTRMVTGAVRVANYAYTSTVKPLAAILGLTPRPKS